MKKSHLLSLFTLLFIASCGYFINSIDGPGNTVLKLETKKLSVIFSHNINAETHPCGCRHHPLGGLPQVAGKMHEIKQDHPIYYVDSGDTLFDNVEVPKSLINSQEYKAENLLKALNLLDLQLFTPGDQDLANGLSYLRKLQKTSRLPILLTNLNNDAIFEHHKKFQIIENGPHRIYFLGVLEPSLIRKPNERVNFGESIPAIEKGIKLIEDAGYNHKDPFHRLILLSHSGIDKDKQIAKKFNQIDWIIGAHTQSFLRKPRKEGNTKIVQILSRNHYLGEIIFDFTGDKTKDKYQIHEMRDEEKNKLKPNPFVAWIDKHKSELKEIQIKEQDLLYKEYQKNQKTFPYETAASCMECHDEQAKFWQGTAHSLAYITLKNAKEENNLSCVKCHSLGTNDPRGFSRVKDLIKFNKDFVKTHEVEKRREDYWKKFDASIKVSTSIREMSSADRVKVSEKWMRHDTSFTVSHNFANVQCLNCHTKSSDHPFDSSEKTLVGEARYKSMKNACLNCHTSDQSPEWYQKDKRGLAGELNELILVEKMKKIACPKK